MYISSGLSFLLCLLLKKNALAEQNLVLLYSVPWSPQGIYEKKELNDVVYMKGIKFRAYNAATARLAELAGDQGKQ